MGATDLTVLILISTLLRFSALVWSIVLLVRRRDWRIGVLALLLLLMTAQEGAALLLAVSPVANQSLETAIATGPYASLVISVLALTTVLAIARLLNHLDRKAPILAKQDLRYRALVEEVDLVSWEFEVATRSFTYVSRAAEDLLGYSLEEWKQPHFWYDHLHPDDREAAADFARSHVARGDRHGFEYRMVHANGTSVWVRDLTTVICENGKPVRLYGVFVDITDRIAAEEALQRSEATHRALLRGVPDLIYRLDRRGVFLDCHAHALDQHPQFSEGVVGRSVTEHFDSPLAQRFMKWIKDALETGEIQVADFERVMDGVTWWFDARIVPNGPDEVLVVARDITVRRETEQAIRNIAEGVAATTGEAFFRTLVTHLSATLGCRWAVVGRTIGEKPYAIETLAFSADGALAKNVRYELANTPCANVTSDQICIYDGNVQRHFPLDHMLVELGALSYAGAALSDAEGRISGILSVLDDKPLANVELIRTQLQVFASRAAAELERMRWERALQESEERIRAIAEHVPGVIYSYDRREKQPRKLIYLGPGLDELIGPRNSARVQQNFDDLFDLVHPDDRENVASHAVIGEAKEDVVDIECRLRHDDGQYRWVRSLCRPIRMQSDGSVGESAECIERELMPSLDEDAGTTASSMPATRAAMSEVHPEVGASVTRWHVVLINISEAKRIERKLRETANTLAALVESAPLAIIMINTTGIVQLWNPAAARLFDWREDEVVGRQLPVIPDDDRANFEEMLRLQLAGESTIDRPVRRRRRDGTLLDLSLSTAPLRDEHGEVIAVIGIYTDIAERLASEQRRRLMMRELDHRVRNNLASLLSLIEMSSRGAATVGAFGKSIRGRVEAMAHVHGLLSQSRWEALEMASLVRAVTPPNCPGSIELTGGDLLVPSRQATAIAMVVHELLTNSLKYGSLGCEGGVVHIAWKRDATTVADVDHSVTILWRESGGPMIEHVPEPGVGTGLIEGLVRSELHGEAQLRYPTDGADHSLLVRFDNEVERNQARSPANATAGISQRN